MSRRVVDTVVKWLFREGDLSLSFPEWMSLAFVTVIKNNPTFSVYFFDRLVTKMQDALNDPLLSVTQKEIILHSTLSYLAFASPQENQKVCINRTEYTIERIQLTSGWLSAPYYAYGLTAKNDSQARSFLIFQGTTTPADHGFLAGALADTRPHGAIGTFLYERGQTAIQEWINAEHKRTGRRVLCTGQSLGGAMSLHAHINQPEQVDFFAINPPYLTHREKRINETRVDCDLEHGLEPRIMKVLTHCNDPVRQLGSHYLPKGTLVGLYGDRWDNIIAAHAQSADCHAGSPDVKFLPYQEKLERNHSWKVAKLMLFLTVCFLHLIALPVRVCIKTAQMIFDCVNKKEKKSGEEDQVSLSEKSVESITSCKTVEHNAWSHHGALFSQTKSTNSEPMAEPAVQFEISKTHLMSIGT